MASACATGTGLYDDLRAIGAFCRERELWFHVDGAHGASALLSDRHRGLLDGIDQADSMVWDAHKMLRTSSLCAAVLVRRARDLPGAFRQDASYLFYEDSGELDIIDRAVECTKAPLGVKLFLNLAWRGERGLGDYVADQYDKALRFWELIGERPGFECPYRPESNILCFRFGRDSDLQVAIRERLIASGEFHLSSVELGGERYLRIVVMNPATDEAHDRAAARGDRARGLVAQLGTPAHHLLLELRGHRRVHRRLLVLLERLAPDLAARADSVATSNSDTVMYRYEYVL